MYVDEDAFRAAVGTLVGLQEAGSVRLLVRGSGWPQFEFTRGDARADEFRQQPQFNDVMLDISDALGALMNDVTVEQFEAVRSDPQRWDGEDDEAEPVDVARRKFEFVAASFDLDDLRRRAWVKSTSKSLVPRSFEWEVAVKHADEGISEAVVSGPAAFATVKLTADPVARGLREPGTALVLTLDGEDVSYLIDALTRLRDALSTTEQETVR